MKTLVDDLGPCVEFQGYRRDGGRGYGQRWFQGKLRLAHRVAFFEAYGYWPEECLHKCDNKPCVRPDHLEDGTHAQNMKDMRDRGLWRVGNHAGVHNGRAKLNPEAVKCIRWLRANGYTEKRVAHAYGISVATVSLITRRKIWKDV